MRLRVAACLCGLLWLAGGAAAERIERFDVEIRADGSDAFEVLEKIRYDFESASRHGIYRTIPVRYGRGRAADYRITLDVLEVTDAVGASRPYRVRKAGSDLEIRIGSADRKVSGVQDYWVRYRIRRAVLWFEEHDEIYWNVTGNAWGIPIDSASALVILPEIPQWTETACFTGRQGSVASACTTAPSGALVAFESDVPLGPGEGLTLVLGLPKGLLAEPSELSRFLDRVSDYVSGFSLIPVAVFAAMFAFWRRHGRDVGVGDALPVRYEPPDGLSPAEVGTVVDEKVDLPDITSTILDLAIRGFLRIEEEESSGFLFLEKKDVRLRKLREGKDLKRHEAILFNRLFSGGMDSVLVSSLKDKFYTNLPEIREALYLEVSHTKGFFPSSPDKVRRNWGAGGVVLGVLAVLAFVMLQRLDAAIALGAAGAIVLAFSRSMPRRTRRGRKAYEEILGFREFLQRVEADRLERSGGRTAGRFEAILPHAIVLGAADEWANAFSDVYSEPPDWYVSRHRGPFNPVILVNDVGSSLSTIGKSVSSQPAPKGGSGSSGLGGGGFSGGGFGGGGGGSW